METKDKNVARLPKRPSQCDHGPPARPWFLHEKGFWLPKAAIYFSLREPQGELASRPLNITPLLSSKTRVSPSAHCTPPAAQPPTEHRPTRIAHTAQPGPPSPHRPPRTAALAATGTVLARPDPSTGGCARTWLRHRAPRTMHRAPRTAPPPTAHRPPPTAYRALPVEREDRREV